MRCIARSIDKAGVSVSKTSYVEKCNFYSDVRSLRNIPTETAIPSLGNSNFIAPNASIIGDVRVGKNSSVWYGSVLRGDLSPIEIGEETVIQDLVTIKRSAGSESVKIGRGVTIGPNCLLGGVVLEDFSYVGMGSTLADGCVIESYAVTAAGAVLEKNTRIPSGQIWAGSPARYLRDVTPDEREAIREHHSEMKSLAAIHSEETEKTFEQVFTDQFLRERAFSMNDGESMYETLDSLGYPDNYIDIPDIDQVKGTEYMTMDEMYTADMYRPSSWRPFKEDAAVFPEDWKIYGEDMDSYERAKKIFDKPPGVRDDTPLSALPISQNPWTRRF